MSNSERGRKVLLYLCVVCCFISTLMTANIAIRGIQLLKLYSNFLVVNNLNASYFHVSLISVGCIGVIVNMSVLLISYRLVNPIGKKSLSVLKGVSLFLMIFFYALCLYLMVFYTVFIIQIKNNFMTNFLTALGKYKSDATIKEQVDRLQVRLECCGSVNYQDWLDIQWYPDDVINWSSEYIKGRLTQDGQYIAPDVPYSCCDSKSFRPCIHHDIFNRKVHANYDPKKDLTIHKIGCSKQMHEVYNAFLFKNILFWLNAMAALNLAAIFLFRIATKS